MANVVQIGIFSFYFCRVSKSTKGYTYRPYLLGIISSTSHGPHIDNRQDQLNVIINSAITK